MSVPAHTPVPTPAHPPVPAAAPPPGRPGPATRTQRRSAAADRLLDGLEALVARHRALAPQSPDDRGLHAELITAEVAHELAMARAALRRTPHLGRTPHLAVVEEPEASR